jgi:hypothetical protein
MKLYTSRPKTRYRDSAETLLRDYPEMIVTLPGTLHPIGHRVELRVHCPLCQAYHVHGADHTYKIGDVVHRVGHCIPSCITKKALAEVGYRISDYMIKIVDPNEPLSEWCLNPEPRYSHLVP